MDLRHGCRSEYGPLDLRIETTASSNGFKVYVEDSRLEHATVYEQTVRSELESAKDYAALRADDYLKSYGEVTPRKVKWRCS